MKKVKTIFGELLFASIILTSCGGNSIESDAKKMSELVCKAQKLQQKALEKISDDLSSSDNTSKAPGLQDVASGLGDMNEGIKLGSEIETLTNEMKSKYSSKEDEKKFEEAFLKEMANCK